MRLTQTIPQAVRTRSLIKQAKDAIDILAFESLNLDADTRAALDTAGQAVSELSSVANSQPTIKPL